MVSTLERLLAHWIGQGQLKPLTLLRKVVQATAEPETDEHSITVQYSRRANNPFRVEQDLVEGRYRIPWLGNRLLGLAFRKNGNQDVT